MIVRGFGGAAGHSLQGVARTGFDVGVAVDKPLGMDHPGVRVEVGRRNWAVPAWIGLTGREIKPADRYLQDRLVIAAVVLSPPAPPGRSLTHERISGAVAGGLGLYRGHLASEPSHKPLGVGVYGDVDMLAKITRHLRFDAGLTVEIVFLGSGSPDGYFFLHMLSVRFGPAVSF